ncbi:MAG: NADH-quinone oxidoreductase subunit N [Bryobacteraceae bacterium]|nr:NADH-quinone oxidoreductase subunit N [Bryobacteraceae bacterium]
MRNWQRSWPVPANFIPSTAEYLRILPELILTLAGVLIMLLEGMRNENEDSSLIPAVTLISIVAAIGASFISFSNPGTAFHGMIVVDGFATFFRVLVLVVGLLAFLSSGPYLSRERAHTGEYWGLLIFSLVGQCIMAAANELMMIFIGLEISSIATYILCGYLRDDKRNNESALKYFLLGSFATAFFLYGIAWIYGITGSTNLLEIRAALSAPSASVSVALVGTSAALMFVGFAFKISVAPFQVWAPDVYQGAPAPVAAFMSAGPKAAAFAILIRVFMTAFESVSVRWEPVFWVCALLTMIVGNFAALAQSNVKRLLAYSSIAHAGYVLVSITAHNDVGVQAAMFYLASYAFMNLGAFAVITHVARRGEQFLRIDDMAGLGYRQPLVAGLMTVFLLSLIGVPLTGGFFGKFYVFKAALDANLVWLTILGLLNSAVAAFYYLRLIVVMYMNEPGESTDTLQPMSAGTSAALWASAVGTVVLGIFPGFVLDFAGRSAHFVK